MILKGRRVFMKNVNEQKLGNRTDLFEAVAYDKIRITKKLLNMGADPNIPDINGTTPLMNAASVNNKEMVDLLLSYNAKPHVKDNFGDDAASYARKQGHAELAGFLKKLAKKLDSTRQP
jgi:ankyrin repeat protein